MTIVHRVLFPEPIASLDEYLARGGGVGLEAALKEDPASIIQMITASGLRGRGGAGFPTGRKWQTLVEYHALHRCSTVVVNGAEGEPGTLKDRTILRTSPYLVIEGALIAARAVGADEVVFGLKKSFGTEVARLRSALEEVKAAGWESHISLSVFEGPNEYLYGEETALLEAIDGRYPFPRIAPPYRRGDREFVETEADVSSHSGLSAHVEMADPGGDTEVPPTLVDNVETIANVPRIVSRGAEWFRTEGTPESPGTIVCTITGDVQREGVGEVIMGTPLGEVIEAISGGPRPGHHIKAVLAGTANALITADQLDAPVSFEGLAAMGSGLGSGGFIVFDDTADIAAVAAGVSRFLAVESCGQCTPCKLDGLALAERLGRLCRSIATKDDLTKIRSLAQTVGDRARCTLATQHQTVIQSVLDRFGDELEAHLAGASPREPALIAELVDIKGTVAVWEERFRQKQPDWTYQPEYSGQTPAEKYGDHRRELPLED